MKDSTDEEKQKQSKIQKDLVIQNPKIYEEETTGNAAILFHNLLFNQKSDPKRIKMIKEAIKLFPEPENSRELEIDI